MVLPIGALLLLAAFAVAAAGGWLLGRRSRAVVVSILADMLIVGVVGARIAFVARWNEAYRDSPWSALDIRDGGFEPWAGVGAALLVAVWRAWRKAEIRLPLAAGIAAGAIAWTGALGALHALESPQGRRMPATALTSLDGGSATVAALASGKPTVVNLWATWCPPCRREMPVLAQAQRARPEVTFIFANQGEQADAIRRYLERDGLDLANVVLDLDGRLGRETRSRGLPTTLFYDAQGLLVEAHMGPLSKASLAAKLSVAMKRRPIE
jgi:thiol-disulfide isomerase/thioredoxin